MGYKEKLQVVLDVDGNGAATGLKGFIGNFRTAVGQAEGFAGKFRAGVGAMGQSLTDFASSGAGMVAIGGAVGTALGKMVMGAEHLALSVGKLSDQTGLSTEQASRWVEVTGDMGISTETLSSLLGKLTQNLGKSPEQFKALGVEVQHASDGAVDMNATLLNAIQVLDSIQDPTKRAELAAKLFGKGWKEASELIGMGADKIKAKLAGVQDAKIMSGQNVKDARAFRDSMEDLKDVTGDMATTIGKELIPALTQAAKGLKGLADIGGTEIAGKFKVSSGVMGGFTETLRVASDSVKGLDDAISGTDPIWQQYIHAQQSATEGAGAMTAATEQARATMFSGTRDTTVYGDAVNQAGLDARDTAKYMDGLKRAVNDLNKAVSKDRSFQEMHLALAGLPKQLQDIQDQLKAEQITSEEAWAQSALAIDDVKQTLLDYMATLGDIPPEVQSIILTEIDQGKYAEAKAQLDALTANPHPYVIVPVAGGQGGGVGGSGGSTHQPGGSGHVNDANGPNRTQSMDDGGQPIVINLIVNDQTVQQITAVQARQRRGTR